MKLKKAEVAVLVITLAAVMFTGGFMLGRSNVSGDVVFSDGLDLSQPAEEQTQDSENVQQTDEQIPEKININTADADTLTQLPGIGDVIAQRIIDYRTANGDFKDISDIMDVSGIGPSVYNDIKDIIVLEG
jgi:comEA protein